jgi:histidinol phosphatase-like PHP family hydrolase
MNGPASTSALNLLLVADVHYVHHAEHECAIAARKATWGLELVRRAIRRVERQGGVDAVVLMGDLVDNGEAAGVEEDLAELRDEVRSLGVPTIVVPGNHDGDPSRLLRLFGDQPGVHCLKGYQLITFVDPYGPNDEASRRTQDLEVLRRAAREQATSPIVVFQHNPVHPPIESTYPYNLTNAGEVMRAYKAAGVSLSVSAHYHPGIPGETADGIPYVTCPALCEAPFAFLMLRLKGRSVSIEEIDLAYQPDELIDCHVHTEYAYCADDVTAQGAVERAEALGVQRMCLTEHAGQLYLSAEQYWGGEFRRDGGLIARERAAGRGRMAEFRNEADRLRSEHVGVGLEVELDADGQLTLLAEDRAGLDVLVGAVHVLPELRSGSPDLRQVTREFMADTERIAASGVDILAHPFRVLRRANLPVPGELYRPVAELLAAHEVAAEINYHTNEPDPRFFETCLHHGVRIAIGSDAHGLWEVGELNPHLQLLLQIAQPEEFSDLLFVPKRLR